MDDPHEIIFTSGTTGEPEGRRLDRRHGDLELDPAGDRLPARPAALDLRDHRPLLHRRPPRLHLADPAPGRHRPHQALEQLRRRGDRSATWPSHGVTHVLWVPTMLYEILRLPNLAEYDTSRLEMIMCGGQPVSVATTRAGARGLPADRLRPGLRAHRGRRRGHVRPAGGRPAQARLGRPALVSTSSCGSSTRTATRCPPGDDGEILDPRPLASPPATGTTRS